MFENYKIINKWIVKIIRLHKIFKQMIENVRGSEWHVDIYIQFPYNKPFNVSGCLSITLLLSFFVNE